MQIVIGRSTNIRVDKPSKTNPNYTPKKKKDEDRRKNRKDRRQSVRDGVIVSLSFKNDRRGRKDRRRKITN